MLRGMVYASKRLTDNAIADFKKVLELTNDEDLRTKATEWLQLLGVNP
jgi:hypothetical protein